jgi:enolase
MYKAEGYIEDIRVREILDSRGCPTVEASLIFDDGSIGEAAVPSGASTGSKEALELRDGGKRYLGKGVKKALMKGIEELEDHIIGFPSLAQQTFDTLLCQIDGTSNKSRLGANIILALSLAYLKASAQSLNIPIFQYLGGITANMLPVPMANVLNGGAHADNNVDFQEFMIVPISAPTYSVALEQLSTVFHTLRSILKSKNYSTGVGDEGGFAPNLSSNEEAITLLLMAIEKAGYKPGEDFYLALDIASSEFYNEEKKKYVFHKSSKEELSSKDLVAVYADLIKKYPIISIEDGMAEDDKEGWKLLSSTFKGKGIQIVGDDLFVTNEKLLEDGIKNQIANSILIKLNQIGTVSETINTIRLAQQNGYATISSHRSGETGDTTIADLAVGLGMGQIKTGSLSRIDRIAKYNQLLRIEESLENPYYPGKSVFKNLL